ncbi:MAG: hypothetical protein IJL80_15050, partial [Treponema sp.]|nr:hypothetical protein [Treponema sp.]
RETDVKTERFLLKKIDWRDRLIQISGSRGAGKTTMLLQQRKGLQDTPLDVRLAILTRSACTG